jgi:hypothetical protein
LHKGALYNVRNSIEPLQACISKNCTSISGKIEDKISAKIITQESDEK